MKDFVFNHNRYFLNFLMIVVFNLFILVFYYVLFLNYIICNIKKKILDLFLFFFLLKLSSNLYCLCQHECPICIYTNLRRCYHKRYFLQLFQLLKVCLLLGESFVLLTEINQYVLLIKLNTYESFIIRWKLKGVLVNILKNI